MCQMASVKKIVSTFKHAHFNDEFRDGYKLIQKVSTRFFDVVERFLKSEAHVRSIVSGISGDAPDKVRHAFLSIKQEIGPENMCCYSAFSAIIECFSPIRLAQTELDVSQTPTLPTGFPMIDVLKQKLKITLKWNSIG